MSNEELAQKIVEELFQNGVGEQADTSQQGTR